jgi:hypothetical protein
MAQRAVSPPRRSLLHPTGYFENISLLFYLL